MSRRSGKRSGSDQGLGDRARDGRALSEPWEAEALALSIALQEAGHFTAQEWSAALGAEIRRPGPGDGAAEANGSSQNLLNALERLVCDKNLVDREGLRARRREWEDAYRNTPHGQPVKLADADEQG